MTSSRINFGDTRITISPDTKEQDEIKYYDIRRSIKALETRVNNKKRMKAGCTTAIGALILMGLFYECLSLVGTRLENREITDAEAFGLVVAMVAITCILGGASVGMSCITWKLCFPFCERTLGGPTPTEKIENQKLIIFSKMFCLYSPIDSYDALYREVKNVFPSQILSDENLKEGIIKRGKEIFCLGLFGRQTDSSLSSSLIEFKKDEIFTKHVIGTIFDFFDGGTRALQNENPSPDIESASTTTLVIPAQTGTYLK